LNQRFPWEQSPGKRFMVELSIMLCMVIIFTVVSSTVVNNFGLQPQDAGSNFGFETISLIMFFIAIFMNFSFHEFMILSSDKKYLEYRTSTLEKQNYLMKYEALKNQVNPHFLFNSLNVLSSLIYQDTEKSDRFIKKFSEVFRYVLEINQEKLVPIKKELNFLDSYFFLQKIRYGENLKLSINIGAHVLNQQIPPLTLQLVVENAIKHNVISKTQQLYISIENHEKNLIIKNNYQYRGTLNGSTGIGQKNILQKYQLIAQKLPEFYIEDQDYIVSLPIIDESELNTF
jgi:sensor histidine kinase YesM